MKNFLIIMILGLIAAQNYRFTPTQTRNLRDTFGPILIQKERPRTVYIKK